MLHAKMALSRKLFQDWLIHRTFLLGGRYCFFTDEETEIRFFLCQLQVAIAKTSNQRDLAGSTPVYPWGLFSTSEIYILGCLGGSLG